MAQSIDRDQYKTVTISCWCWQWQKVCKCEGNAKVKGSNARDVREMKRECVMMKEE